MGLNPENIFGKTLLYNMNFNKLKVFILLKDWTGGTINFFHDALKELGIKTESYLLPGWNFFRKRFIPTRFLTIDYTRKKLENYYFQEVNKEIQKKVIEFNPNILLVQNESDLLPETLDKFKQRNILLININGDYAFDSTRYKFFPILLKFYDYIFYGEKIWLENYKRVAPNTKFIKTVGAYSEKYFKPLDKSILDSRPDLKAQVSFAGSSYGFKAEGHYRVEIINNLVDYGLKIWGGDRWDRYWKFYPELEKCYQGKHLNFSELNILYQNSLINLNITNPQCITTFQQRTFEIAAARAFQIADYKEEIYDYFNEDEIVTFKEIDELKDKVSYFLNDPEKRLPYIEKAYMRVMNSKNTYKDRILEYLQYVFN